MKKALSILIKKKDIKWTEELVKKMHTDYCESHPGEGGFGDVSVHDGKFPIELGQSHS